MASAIPRSTFRSSRRTVEAASIAEIAPPLRVEQAQLLAHVHPFQRHLHLSRGQAQQPLALVFVELFGEELLQLFRTTFWLE